MLGDSNQLLCCAQIEWELEGDHVAPLAMLQFVLGLDQSATSLDDAGNTALPCLTDPRSVVFPVTFVSDRYDIIHRVLPENLIVALDFVGAFFGARGG